MIVYTDGGCTNSNQTDASKREMVFVVTNEDGAEILVEKTQPRGSNNIAELLAVREALQWAKDNHIHTLEIRTDSRNNFAWVDGRFGKKLNDRERVAEIHNEIASLKAHVAFTLVWVPREENEAGIYLEMRQLEEILGPDVSSALLDAASLV